VATFSIVFVCTGNRFRSPLAEAFVRRLTLGLPVSTESCGTLEIDDAPALPEALELATAYGVDLSSHRTRHITDLSLREVDLVLGFEEAHVLRAVVDAEAPRNRAFTVREIDRLLLAPEAPQETDPVTRARRLVDELDVLRMSQPRSEADDLPDPFRRSRRVYRDTAAEIRDLSVLLTAKLFGVRDAPGLPSLRAKREHRRSLLWPR
jgi:protein-tyrosine phosphatase